VRVIDDPAALAGHLDARRGAGDRVGLVPTMGALHAGHRSLIERAAAECDTVVVTLFVNPLQFDDPADLGAYPRHPDRDRAVAAQAGATVLFAPSVEQMYPGHPAPPATTVHVTGLTDVLEGASRPGHFDGVATVVTKLFALAGRCRAYFGEKDFQQLAVVRRLAADLSLPVEVVGCPTVREPDGLALSSRNARLTDAGREAAAVLRRALDVGLVSLLAGERDPDRVAGVMADTVMDERLVTLDYAVAVDADTLRPPVTLHGDIRLLVAARVGGVRLIDNDGVRLGPPSDPSAEARRSASLAGASPAGTVAVGGGEPDTRRPEPAGGGV
jgi:pantoate--beta-alanine ligase